MKNWYKGNRIFQPQYCEIFWYMKIKMIIFKKKNLKGNGRIFYEWTMNRKFIKISQYEKELVNCILGYFIFEKDKNLLI